MQGPLLASILPMQSKRPRLWLTLVGAALFFGLFVFLNVGRWLVAEDPLRKADAIAVLSGRMPNRALEAARVYKQGYARRVWLTHSTEPGAELEQLSIPYVGEESYDKQILIHEGVPADAIAILDPPIANTADEMNTIGGALRRENLNSVIIVTSKVHTRRVKALWKRLSAHDELAVIHGVSDDPFDPAHWWRTTGDALDVVRELLGLAHAWAGLPLRPAS
ncbi:MAG: YdcF family protein [Candidatus Acidiferrum sp.]